MPSVTALFGWVRTDIEAGNEIYAEAQTPALFLTQRGTI